MRFRERVGKRLLIAIFLLLAALGGLTGCGPAGEAEPEELVINVYDPASGYVGTQGGWYARILEEKLHVTLNFLDPLEADAMEKADLLICGEDTELEELLQDGSLLDLEPWLPDLEIWGYENQLRYWNGQFAEEGIFVIPSRMSRLSPEVSTEEDVPEYGIYINWEAYAAAGYPRIRNREALLEVLEEMLAGAAAQEGTGADSFAKPEYGVSLYREENDTLLDQLSRIIGAYGYETQGLALYRQDDRRYLGLLDDGLLLDGPLKQTVRWLWEANQRGLLDPASAVQDKQQAQEKYAEGRVCLLSCPQLWTYGYELAPLEDMEVVSYGCNPKGSLRAFAAVNSRTEHPQRVIELLDWLYSSEGIMDSGTHTACSTAGPMELTWTVEEGEPRLTEFGRRVLNGEDEPLPDGWGEGTWQEGYCRLSLQPVIPVEVSPSGFLYNYKLWNSTSRHEGPVWEDWCARMEAADAMDYLMANGRLSIIPAYVAPAGSAYEDPEEIGELRALCRGKLEEYLWKIIFAEDERRYESLWEAMEKEVAELGYQQVVDCDFAKLERLRGEREEAAR